MADPKKKDIGGLDEIPTTVGDEAPVDLDALADEALDAGVEGAILAELDAARAERDEMKERYMRALAETENVRKRGERDRREAEQFGGSRLARDLLPVYDSLSRALASVPAEGREANKALLEGVELTLRELVNIFTKHGIKRIVPERGMRFDPQLHQAMFEAPVPGTRAGDIIEVMAEGFQLHDRLLRPAQVGVSSMPGQ